MSKKLIAVLGLIFLLLIIPQLVSAQFDDPISPEDQATFDQILEPVLKIYNLVKYVATFIAVIVMLFAGITYILSGSNAGKRENAKNMVIYVAIGLFIIWAAPIFVQFLI